MAFSLSLGIGISRSSVALLGADAAVAPVNTVPPVASFSIATGLASVTNGTWINIPTSFAYQWFHDGSPVGTSGPTLDASGYDVDDELYCEVSATNSGGTGSEDSNTVEVEAEEEPTGATHEIEFTDVSGIEDGFRVYVGPAGDTLELFDTLDPETGTGNTVEVDITGRPWNTEEDIEVVSFDGATESAVASLTRFTEPELALSGISATADGSYALEVDFDTPIDPPVSGGYLVEYHGPSDPEFSLTAFSATLPVPITGLIPDCLYTVRGYAVNINADDSYSRSPVSTTATATTEGVFDIATLSPAIWLDADDGNTIYQDVEGTTLAIGGGDISRWNNKGSLADFVSTGEAANPSRTLVARNGRDAISFDGVFNSLQTETALAAASLFAGGTDATVFLVYRPAATADQYHYVWEGDSPSVIALHGTWGDGVIYSDLAHTSTGRVTETAPVGWEDNFHIIETWRDGADMELLADGVLLDSRSDASGSISGSSVFLLMSHGISGFAAGEVLEFILLPYAATTPERASVNQYLAAKWGFTLP